METNVVLVVLVGLPGVGKSTLCKKLSFHLMHKWEGHTVQSIHVCYDNLIPLSLQEKFFKLKQCGEENQTDDDNWKSARRNVYSSVDQLIQCLKMECQNDMVLNFFNISNKVVDKEALYVVLLDDNFYYRSMRYEYFQLARKHTIGFCQLYIECTTDTAIQQNMHRQERVPSMVIEAMAAKLQPPLPSENSWESNTYILQANNLDKSQGVWDLIYQCFTSPVPQLDDHELEKAEARLKCSHSVAHQADIYLRSLVSQAIRAAHSKGNMGSNELSSLSCDVNVSRQSVLAAVRNGTLCFPPNLAETVSDENREEFQSILEFEFRKKLKES
ncbi:hypothetical protein OTU49_004162 [Cherax quadricarinatus]|uniref:L-seryl-tRNA(Sec) kinase n=1 Tax=Cherax quadricarinatus TaxID=27406 RepID=A0AAW0X1R0_CHEQU